jgi:hypothetical protein
MHIKCTHNLCSLLCHILINSIVYKDLEMFSIESEDFLNDPLSFGFNTSK